MPPNLKEYFSDANYSKQQLLNTFNQLARLPNSHYLFAKPRPLERRK
jgi:hypothetical protein